jgi:DNA-directed RNA polymerase subunit M
MEFCPKCGAMMLPHDKELKCMSCGTTKKLGKTDADKMKVSEKVDAKENVVMTDGDVRTLPTTNVKCPKCGHGKAEWWLRQTRSADEAETRFFKCLKCKHTWREYD